MTIMPSLDTGPVPSTPPPLYSEQSQNNYALSTGNARNTPSSHVQMSMFNTTFPKTAAAGSHMDTETFNQLMNEAPDFDSHDLLTPVYRHPQKKIYEYG